MNYRCPKHKTCDKINCAKHYTTNRFAPVHEPCDWYKRHLDRELRRLKLDKINDI